MTDRDEFFMAKALELAEDAYSRGEVPVGCVIVHEGHIIACGANSSEADSNALRHAELIAIERACKKLNSRILDRCTMYVTLEPCPMCAGAVINSRIGTVIFGARDQRMGACGSVIDLFYENFGFKPSVCGGIMAERCGALLTDFFAGIRGTKRGKEQRQSCCEKSKG